MQLSKCIGGEVIDSYAVQDKVQEAELDPTMIIEDELFAAETYEPCIVCGELDDGHSAMYCDGCDKAVHIFCAGFDDAPEVWYCENCIIDMENSTELPGLGRALRRRPRRRPAPPATTGRRLGGRHETSWARVWQEVLRGTQIDLDFPFEEEEDPLRDTRTPQQRREFRIWQRRFEAAESRGANARLRGIVVPQVPQPAVRPDPESQEELRAWNAFEKAQDVRSGRKRRATASPASPREPDAEPRKLKRPRLRRPAGSAASPPAESSSAAAQRAGEGSNFISSLLREVENRASSASAGSPAASDHLNGQQSPRNSSPARSPGSSGYGSGRAGSASPPLAHQHSPLPTLPLSPPSHTFSPFSPAVESLDPHTTPSHQQHGHHRGRRRDNNDSGYDENYHNGPDATSPSRLMSYSSKQEIQRMVKLALAPRYREQSISKDQYTDINRDVSRKMYDLVGDASALMDHANRARWQGVAEEEVRKAIEGMRAGLQSPPKA